MKINYFPKKEINKQTFLLNVVNSLRHLKQFVSSFHSGACSTSNIESDSLNGGYWSPNKRKSYFRSYLNAGRNADDDE